MNQISEYLTLPTQDRIATLVHAFRRAIELATEYRGATAPNPPVGCVLLDSEGRELASAAHQKAGSRHAEALALEQCRLLGRLDRLHTAVVTLEPCNHTGRTGPCTLAILGSPIREVWIGAKDPNGHVEGGGAERLVKAGLSVHFIADLPHLVSAELADAALQLIGPFAKLTSTGLPWVTVKQAVNRDGTMLPPRGRKTFTSDISLDLAHKLRRRADAIVTGSGTVLADAPEFTVRRVPDHVGKHRHLVILDRRRRVPASYLEAARNRAFNVSVEASLPMTLARLGAAGILEVLVEAGPELSSAVLATELWDEHVLIRQGSEGTPDTVTKRLRTGDEKQRKLN